MVSALEEASFDTLNELGRHTIMTSAEIEIAREGIDNADNNTFLMKLNIEGGK